MGYKNFQNELYQPACCRSPGLVGSSRKLLSEACWDGGWRRGLRGARRLLVHNLLFTVRTFLQNTTFIRMCFLLVT